MHGITCPILHSAKCGINMYAVIVGLDTHADYDIRVLAGTKAGYPDLDDSEWPWVTGTTGIVGDNFGGK